MCAPWTRVAFLLYLGLALGAVLLLAPASRREKKSVRLLFGGLAQGAAGAVAVALPGFGISTVLSEVARRSIYLWALLLGSVVPLSPPLLQGPGCRKGPSIIPNLPFLAP